MDTLTIRMDSQTAYHLRQLSRSHGADMAEMASRLLARAVRAARLRPAYNIAAIAAANAPFADEDEALAESGSTERADLLAAEDEA